MPMEVNMKYQDTLVTNLNQLDESQKNRLQNYLDAIINPTQENEGFYRIVPQLRVQLIPEEQRGEKLLIRNVFEIVRESFKNFEFTSDIPTTYANQGLYSPETPLVTKSFHDIVLDMTGSISDFPTTVQDCSDMLNYVTFIQNKNVSMPIIERFLLDTLLYAPIVKEPGTLLSLYYKKHDRLVVDFIEIKSYLEKLISNCFSQEVTIPPQFMQNRMIQKINFVLGENDIPKPEKERFHQFCVQIGQFVKENQDKGDPVKVEMILDIIEQVNKKKVLVGQGLAEQSKNLCNGEIRSRQQKIGKHWRNGELVFLLFLARFTLYIEQIYCKNGLKSDNHEIFI
jgi:hypothetical protein